VVYCTLVCTEYHIPGKSSTNQDIYLHQDSKNSTLHQLQGIFSKNIDSLYSWYCITRVTLNLLTVLQAEKGANLKDVQDFMVTVPTLEYHNCNWTWTDMLMEVKKVYKQHIIQKVSEMV